MRPIPHWILVEDEDETVRIGRDTQRAEVRVGHRTYPPLSLNGLDERGGNPNEGSLHDVERPGRVERGAPNTARARRQSPS